MPRTTIGRTRIGLTDRFVTIEEVRTTLPTQLAADELATALVELGLAACVQIIGPISSVYRWQGTLNKDAEFSLYCKTTASRLLQLLDYLRAHHPYKLPEILTYSIQASTEYGRWLNEQVEGDTRL